MLAGQALGPFVIEKELGAGAMGAVYLGRYTKTGQRVAIKLMAPGLGNSNPTAIARFEREAAILKQFNHRNIVRLFGVGKHQGTRYYAMEYIEGESLDRVMSRRGRMTWEEVVTLGRQLCDALQHAHEQGIVHRDLKPSNLMVLPDGTLKLTDFGIAKDLDVTALTSANCTVGTAAYMSPEQCKGERNLTHKSDLYSLGVLFYELLTGRRPFNADNAMDMFLLHVNGTFERPSRIVLDIPIWLDTLVCQLMEKDPGKRPRDAATVAGALAGIQEKVEAQLSAGVDVARRRVADRLPGQKGLTDEEDREAARTLLGARKAKRKKSKAFYERAWFQAAGILLLLAALGTILYAVFGPASPETLYAQAEQLMKSGNPDKEAEARNGPIQKFLDRYGKRTDPQTQKMREQMQKWADDYDFHECETKLQKYVNNRRKNSPIPYQAQGDVEEQAFKAAWDEEEGKLEQARTKWEGLQKNAPRRWSVTAARHLAQLDLVNQYLAGLNKLYDSIDADGKDPELEGEQARAFLAVRYERFGDPARARERFARLEEDTETDAAKRVWNLLAAQKARELTDRAKEFTDQARLKLVKDRVEKAKKSLEDTDVRLRSVWARCQDVIVLYKDDPDPDVKALAGEAQGIQKGVDKKLLREQPPS